jgi:hypothetical protein
MRRECIGRRGTQNRNALFGLKLKTNAGARQRQKPWLYVQT